MVYEFLVPFFGGLNLYCLLRSGQFLGIWFDHLEFSLWIGMAMGWVGFLYSSVLVVINILLCDDSLSDGF